ncbi:MAG: hypothetical protein QOG80_1397 [Pseudonocardiales bacterium]|nr:hypothetical protein [Pseudonocardiales bacterium]
MPSVLRVPRLGGRAAELLLIGFVIVAGAAAGFAGVHSAKLGAVAVAGLVVLMLTAQRPVVLGIVAVSAVFAVQRLGGTSVAPGSSGGVSYSDALLAAALVMAVPALIGTVELSRLRIALQGTAVYLALLLPSMIANPAPRVYLEWTHRLVILAGSLLVGAWIARERRIRDALRLLTLVACFISAAAIVSWLRHGLHPATPFNLNKNFIGAILGGVTILLVIGTNELGLGRKTRLLAVLLVGGGLLVAQSRGGDLAAAFGLLVAFALDPKAHSPRLKAGAAVVGIVLAVFAFISIRDQFNLKQQDLKNSSVGVRYNVERVTRDIWRTDPLVGVGMKYFNTHKYGPYAFPANNVVDNELAESGLFGLGGFVLLEIMTVAAGIRRRGEPLVAAALGMALGQLLHGMVDIYWAAGVVSLPYLILGMALAKEPVSRTEAQPRRWQRRQSGAHRVELSA